jgi:RNA polymerase sigma-70 factor, ECF subfamily
MEMADRDTAKELHADLRTAWHRYVDLLAPLRPDLYGYCRRLAGDVWDAEDLVQDTLLRGFGRWGASYGGEVRNPRAYLLRAATNATPCAAARTRRVRCARAPSRPPTSLRAPSSQTSCARRERVSCSGSRRRRAPPSC